MALVNILFFTRGKYQASLDVSIFSTEQTERKSSNNVNGNLVYFRTEKACAVQTSSWDLNEAIDRWLSERQSTKDEQGKGVSLLFWNSSIAESVQLFTKSKYSDAFTAIIRSFLKKAAYSCLHKYYMPTVKRFTYEISHFQFISLWLRE